MRKPCLPKRWVWHTYLKRYRVAATNDDLTLRCTQARVGEWSAVLCYGVTPIRKAQVEGFPSCIAAIRAVEAAMLAGKLVLPRLN
jgi:hypothetical protein